MVVFAIIVIVAVVWILVLGLVPWGDIEKKKFLREQERKKAIEEEERIRSTNYNNYLKKQSLKLTPGYAVRRDGRIKKIPEKYLQALNAPYNAFTPDHTVKLRQEFFRDYPHFKR